MSFNTDDQLLFWGMVLSPVLFKPPDDPRSNRQILLQLAKEQFLTPQGVRRSYSFSTLKRKLKAYREKGAQGFIPSLRSDEGTIRYDRDKSLQRAIELKQEAPTRSHSKINLILRSEGLETIPASTLLRHLHQHGMTLKKLGYQGEIVRKRWTCPHTHDMWVGDFSQGPTILDKNGEPQKTWISAFIDVHSRFLVVGIYAKTCDMSALVSSLLAAFEKHGKPSALYLDNAKVYRSPILSRACLELGIDLIHRTVRDPQGGGIIERFFLSAQKQFESEFCTKGKTPLSLARLNELFGIYVDEVYHRSNHSETKQAPAERYSKGLLHPVQVIRREHARQFFYREWKRTVHQDFADVTIDLVHYACDIKLRGDKVLLKGPIDETPDHLEVYDLKGRKKIGEATKHDRSQRRFPDPSPPPEDQTDYAQVLEKIRDINREQDKSMTSIEPCLGYEANSQKANSWTLENFVTRVCQQTEVDPTDLDDNDLQQLSLVHSLSCDWTVGKVKRAWARCEPKSLQQLLLELSQTSSGEES